MLYSKSKKHLWSPSRPRFLLLNFTRALMFRAAKLSGTRLIIGSVLSLIISNYVSRLSSRPCSRWLQPMGEKGRALIHVRCYYCHSLSGDHQLRLNYAVSPSFNLKPKFTLLTPKTDTKHSRVQTIGLAGVMHFGKPCFFLWK